MYCLLYLFTNKNASLQGGTSIEAVSDSDDEPALKQPRLSRKGSPRSPRIPRSPRRQRTPVNARCRENSTDSRQSASEVKETHQHVFAKYCHEIGS